jgi:hypothetical protein
VKGFAFLGYNDSVPRRFLKKAPYQRWRVLLIEAEELLSLPVTDL